MFQILFGSCFLAISNVDAPVAITGPFQFQPESAVSLDLSLDDDESAVAVDKPAFGEQGSVRGQFGATIASDFNDTNLFLVNGSVSWFILDGFSVDLELDAGYVNQSEAGNGVGGGAGVMIRWHMIRKPTWSFYGEAGAGMFFSSVDVPEGSGQVKFSPQVGFGVSFDVAEDLRMMVGARWVHLSNARTTSNNPGFDGLGLYAMLSFGF